MPNKVMVSKICSEWKSMNDSEKLKYVQLAEEDRKRYEKEKAAYDNRKTNI